MEEVYRNLFNLLQRRSFKEAERLCLFELGKLSQPDARLLFYLGASARMQLKNDAALVAFKAALEIEATNVDYLQAAASAYEAVKDYQKSYELMAQVVKLAPDDNNALANYAVSLERLNRLGEASEIYAQVIEKDALQIVANTNYGSVLHKLNRKKEALAHNRIAHMQLPHHFGTLYNLVDTLIANFQYEEALVLCKQGLAWQPRHAHLMMKKAMVLGALSRHDESLVACSEARIIYPYVVNDFLPWTRYLENNTTVYMDGHVFDYEVRYVEQKECFWLYRSNYIQKLQHDIDHEVHKNRALAGHENAFKVLSVDLNASRRLALIRNMSVSVEEDAWLLLKKPFKYAEKCGKKIRIGYISSNFREHPNKALVKQLFSYFDKEKFEINVYSLFNPGDKNSVTYREYLVSMCDLFHDVSSMSTLEIAELINQEQVDILVDLAGYTAYSRPEVMALRPAPIQMQHLGFQGSMGADFIDYAILDKTVCQDGCLDEWHESPVRLPHSLFPYDSEIDNSVTEYVRADFGLPENALVFCCFNNSYKIEPLIFERWMNVLKAVPASVLWLLGKDTDVQENLEREAEARGVDKSRLIFAGRVPMEQHLLRYQLADLFLDTYWHNAHTTGAEALWQGLPLISILGEVPSARGAASILTALEMPELIVQDFDEYEQLAIFYATHPAEYAAMREKLKAKRYTAPMYNTKLTVKHIESAYKLAWERYQAGLPPAPIDVPEILDPALRKSIH